MPDNILEQIFSPHTFTPAEREAILAPFRPVTFEKGDFLLRAGDLAQHYWFVETGFLRSYALDPEGDEVSTNFFGRGDIVIDWPAFFMRAPTREYIQALTPGAGWQLDYETFQRLFHSIEAFREAGRARLVQSYFQLKRHSLSLITDPAKDRYLRLLTEKPGLVQNVPLKQLATYLGITDTSLSRIRKAVAREE